jgi:hypothetical protein
LETGPSEKYLIKVSRTCIIFAKRTFFNEFSHPVGGRLAEFKNWQKVKVEASVAKK